MPGEAPVSKTVVFKYHVGMAGMNLINFIREAVRAVPAVKYAMGIGGILAVVALVRTFGLDAKIAIFGLIIMFVAMGILLLFAHAARAENGTLSIPALIFTYFVLFMFMVVSISTFTSVFFSKPVDLQYWLTGKITDQTQNTSQIQNTPQALNLPDADSGWVDGGLDPDRYCNPILDTYKNKYPNYNISVKPYPEQHRSEYNPFKHDIYRYTCSFSATPK